ncbi:MAG: hypothetical protein WC438_05960 [Candidatus Pacearchaeota archaeon]|jgi:hypothetical protein
MEEIKKVETVQIDYKCPDCDKGYLRPTGVPSPRNPTFYQHKCTCCGYTEDINKKYPYIEYREIINRYRTQQDILNENIKRRKALDVWTCPSLSNLQDDLDSNWNKSSEKPERMEKVLLLIKSNFTVNEKEYFEYYIVEGFFDDTWYDWIGDEFDPEEEVVAWTERPKLPKFIKRKIK